MKKVFLFVAVACLMFPCLGNAEWLIETIDTIGNIYSGFPSLGLDDSNYSRISYYDYTSADLLYAVYDGAQWNIDVVDSAGDVGWYTSLKLDSDNHAHISYQDITNIDLKYAQWTGSSWVIELVDTAGIVGSYTSLCLKSDSSPVIVSSGFSGDYLQYYLKYSEKVGVNWITSVIDSCPSSEFFFDSRLVLDSTDAPHVSYCHYVGSNADLKYAYLSGTWTIETVATSLAVVGPYSSLGLDQADTPHIAFRASNGNLKYGTRTGPANWQISTVESGSNTGWCASLAFDNADLPRVAYADDANILKYAAWSGTSWTLTTVDTTGGAGGAVGPNTSLVLDPSNNPYAAYVTNIASTSLLRLAHWENTGIEDNSKRTSVADAILLQSLPNPFNKHTLINYQLTKSGFTTLKVYNVAGQLVKTLVNEQKQAGDYIAFWDGKSESGESVADGVYFYQLTSNAFSDTEKLILSR